MWSVFQYKSFGVDYHANEWKLAIGKSRLNDLIYGEFFNNVVDMNKLNELNLVSSSKQAIFASHHLWMVLQTNIN